MKFNRLILVLFLFFLVFTFAQYTIKAVVTDENGKPASNAKVAVPGSNTSTTTNEAGEFILKGVPSGTANLEVTPERKDKPTLKVGSTEVIDSVKEDELVNGHADTENIPTISTDDE